MTFTTLNVHWLCDCSMTFTSAAVGGQPLALGDNQRNNLIWAYHTTTFLKQYHGFATKGKLKNFTFSGENDGSVPVISNVPDKNASPSAAVPFYAVLFVCQLAVLFNGRM
jgi:hypothetical protein